MSWTLVYTAIAGDQLARLLDGADPAVILSVARLNAVLESCPRSAGESRETGRRVAFDGPVAVRYELDEVRREVRVTGIRRMDRRMEGESTDAGDDGS